MKPKWKKLYHGTYCLQDDGPASKVNIFLLIGAERALLIDSGYGLLDLPSLIREITSQPVILVNTHGHLDHANGSWQFEETYLRSEDLELYHSHCTPEFLHRSFQAHSERLSAIIAASPAHMRLLDSIREIDLGGRRIGVLHVPGHTKGSVFLIDEKNHAAFTGDNLCKAIWLSLPESVSVAAYRDVLGKLLPQLRQKKIRWNYSAHIDGKTCIQRDIKKFIDCCGTILAGKKQPRFMDFGITSGSFLGTRGRYILYPKE